ncbi:MAG TPA: M23 family metallopeptidase [Longimicrobiales bacterium]
MLELGRRYTAWFYAESLDRLLTVFSSELVAGMGGEAGLRAFREQVATQLGAERRVVDERLTRAGRGEVYLRLAEFEKYDGVIEVVAASRDGIEDNRPGVLNAAEPLGNHVVLGHGNGEYSFLAHLRKGSVRVRVGDRVSAGDRVGECGNSGDSSEPHLHYHLQTTPDFGRGAGLPAQFREYVAGGEPVERGEPVQGQRIRPAGG